MDARRGEVDHAIEHVRPGHENHARADGDEAQRGTELVAHRDRANDASQQGRAEGLQQDVGAVLTDDAPQKGTASAAAPAAAARANSHVGAGGACEIALSAARKAGGAITPASRSAAARMAEPTRSISTPVGSAALTRKSVASPSLG